MQSKLELKNEILDDMNLHNDKEMPDRVDKLIQKMYFKICKKISWAPLRDSIELDFDDETSGLLLPSNLFGIDRVRDETNEIDFILRDEQEIADDESGYRAYQTYPSRDPLFRADDLRLNNGATSFTSTKLDTWVALAAANLTDGEFIKVGSEPGYYEINSDTSPYGIEDTYYGPDMIQADFMIRPPETTRLYIIDPDENNLSDRTVKVFYWSSPRPLYNDNDPIILPDATILKLKVLRELPEAKRRRPVSQKEMEEAMSEAKRLNPQNPINQSPRDKNNNLFNFNKNLFKRRS